MDLDEDGVSKAFCLRGYDPVTVAASLQLRLPIDMLRTTAPPVQQVSFFHKRRLSLIEALNNSIQDDFVNFEAFEDPMLEPTSSRHPERIYSVKQILSQNHDLLDRGRHSMRVPRIYVKNVREEPQEVPRIMRCRPTKRSKSQPNNNSNSNSSQDSESEYEPGSHVSRIECGDVWQRGCRCSLQSTCSSIASRSGSTSSGDSGITLAEASWDHVALLPDELPFASGDVITVLDSSSQAGLWFGSCGDSQGWFPSSHVRVISCNSISRPTSTCASAEWDPSLRSRRGKVVEELMHTEREYVRLLEDIVQGFLEQTRRRSELFSPQRVRNIFGNLSAIYSVHCKLLRELEMAYDQATPENSNIGSSFLRNKNSFAIYSDYCNNRPVSCAELAQLSRQPLYRQFFEACRLLRGLPNLSLEGFLLTPVQRICRYPLQLAELLKATPSWHEDYAPLDAAERAMRGVAAQINDKKRRVEALQDIARFQRSVHGWRGMSTRSERVATILFSRPKSTLILRKAQMLFLFYRLLSDYMQLRKIQKKLRNHQIRVTNLKRIIFEQGPDLLENNSALLHSGEVYVKHMLNGHLNWSKDVLVFLFDQSLIICKKDLIKKNYFVFKERLALDSVSYVDCRDGKDPTFGCSTKNAFKLVGSNRQYLIVCPDKKSKASWKAAFEQRANRISPATSEERRLAIVTLNSMNYI